jgi:hypothetical protein
LRHDGGSAILRKYPTRCFELPWRHFSIVLSSQEAQVQRFFRPIGGVAAIAILTAVALTGAPQAAAPQEKKMKDQAEFDIYDAAGKDLVANNGAKALEDLNTWKQKYPTSDFKNDGEYMYVQAYTLNKQFDKVLDKVKELMGQNLDSLFPDPKTGPQLVVKILYAAVMAIQQLPTPTPEQLAIGSQAAHQILDYTRKPEGVSDSDWTTARNALNTAANDGLYQIALAPGRQAVAKKDCPGAEAAWSKALGDYPDKTVISWQLASSYNCEKKPFLALYEYARAVAVDPSLGKSMDPAKSASFVKNTYTKLHGSDEGYDALLAQAKTAPLPPADFKIVTEEEITIAAAEKFAKENPELAVYKNIKDNLVSQGAPFFENMKGAELPPLIGILVDAKPACRSKTLILYVPLPENAAKTPEITIKLETALTGKPDITSGSPIKFVGVGDSFTASPFMLTLTAEKDKVQDLKVTPCVVAPAKKGVKK